MVLLEILYFMSSDQKTRYFNGEMNSRWVLRMVIKNGIIGI